MNFLTLSGRKLTVLKFGRGGCLNRPIVWLEIGPLVITETTMLKNSGLGRAGSAEPAAAVLQRRPYLAQNSWAVSFAA